ncbi:MAG: zinc ribbon domain-containing protein [Sulfolobaceae archaeon]
MVKVCPRCGYVNDDQAIQCVRCGFPLQQPFQPSPQSNLPYYPPTYPKKKSSLPILGVIIAVIVIIAVAAVFFHPPFLNKPISKNVITIPVVTTYTETVTSSTSVVPPYTTSTTTQTPISPLSYTGSVISFNGIDQYFITPEFNITVNGRNITVGLFNYVAMKYDAETIAVRAYLTPYTQGVIIGLSKNTLPFNTPYSGWSPLVYMSDGQLIIADINSVGGFTFLETGVGNSIPTPNGGEAAMAVAIPQPGFYCIVFEEWTNDSGTYVAGYINGQLIGEFYSTYTNASSLFGQIGPYKYNFVGIAFTKQWPQTNYQWYPFNGSISDIIVYPSELTQSQIEQLMSGTTPKGYLVYYNAPNVNYSPKVGEWYPTDSYLDYPLVAVGNPTVITE